VTDPLPGRDPELIAQIVAQNGDVIAADGAAQGLPAVIDVAAELGERRILRVDRLAPGIVEEVDTEDAGPFVVVADGVTVDGRPATVLVAASLEDASTAQQVFVPLLGLGLPGVLGVVGLVTWFLTGRSLRPVDEMRKEADRISALALDRRLPVPETRDELERLGVTLNAMLERLEGSAIRQRRFVGNASHELKSPLTTLRTIVDVAERDPSVIDVADLVSDLGGEIDRIELLVGDLLALARYDEGATGTPAPVDVTEVAEAAVAETANPRNVAVDIGDMVPVVVLADRSALTQAVRNVIENAVRHAATTVWLGVDRTDGFGRVRISDDGSGVAVADAERVFERFVRLDESRARDTGGTGLGLAVARAIARTFEGDVRLGAPLHEGATFEILVPLAPPRRP
jgi:signal transduction histidine kinase